MAQFTLPKIDLPRIELPEIDAERLAALAKDAVYVTIGFGVLAFQQAQVRRQDLTKQLEERFGSSRGQFDSFVKNVEQQVNALDERFATLEARLDQLVEQVKDRLPDPAGELLVQAHDAAKTARKQVRELITPKAA